MATGLDLDSYIPRFMARPWQMTDFYTYCVFFILQTIHRDLTKASNMETAIFDTMWAYAKFYNPSEYLVLDKVTVKFKGTVYSQVKEMFSTTKIYGLCGGVRVYL